MPVKSVKRKISKTNMCFLLMSQGSFNPKIRFLGQKVCSVSRIQTDTHESEYRGHPFRVSGIFLLPISRIGPISNNFIPSRNKRRQMLLITSSCPFVFFTSPAPVLTVFLFPMFFSSKIHYQHLMNSYVKFNFYTSK